MLSAGAAHLIEDDRRLERLAGEDDEIDLRLDDLRDERGIVLRPGDVVDDQQRRDLGGNRTAPYFVGHATALEALVVDDRHACGRIARGDQRGDALSLAIVATGETKDAAPPGWPRQTRMARPRRDHDDARARVDRRRPDGAAGADMADDDVRFVLDGAGGDGRRFIRLAAVVLVRDGETPAEQAAVLVDIADDLRDAIADGPRYRLARVGSVGVRHPTRIDGNDADLAVLSLYRHRRSKRDQRNRHSQQQRPRQNKRQPRGLPFACRRLQRHATRLSSGRR